VNGVKTVFPSADECLYAKYPNGCQINLDGKNYGNHGTLNAYYFTDANNNMDYPTFEWYPNELDWSTETGLRCNQCETKVNATRLENDPCYNNPLSDNFYCDGANMTTCYASVSSYYHKKDLSRKHNNIDSITYEYAMRGCSIENPNTKSQITYGWVNGNKRSLQTNPGTNTSIETTFCEIDGCNTQKARWTTNHAKGFNFSHLLALLIYFLK